MERVHITIAFNSNETFLLLVPRNNVECMDQWYSEPVKPGVNGTSNVASIESEQCH